MNFAGTSARINPKDYDEIISLGNRCATTMMLRELGVYKQSYPFDFVPTTPGLILRWLKDSSSFYPERNVVRTKDGVWFGHFNVANGYDETILVFKRRFDRLLDALRSKKRILFVYSSEADVFNEMGNRYNRNYDTLLKIRKYIIDEYGYSNFTILALHVNKNYSSFSNIVNLTINVHPSLFSDNMETHRDDVTHEYNRELKKALAEVFYQTPS
jgi:hypothetical protein